LKLRPRAKGMARLASLQSWGPRASSFIFILIAASLFLISMVHPGALQGARTSAADLFAPLLSAVNRPIQYAAEYVQAATGIAEMQAENTRLRHENARLRDWYQTALLLEDQNKALQNLLNLQVEPQHRFVTARVIADSGNAYVKSLLVLAGRAQNVEKGQAALAADGLIGRVIEAGNRTARILLLTDINSRIPVQIQGSGQQAVMGGNNNALPTLLHLPPDTVLEPGARVITSGHGGLFPFGLPVGEVVFDDHGRAAVKPYAVLDRVTYVRVLERADDPYVREGRLD